MSDPPPHEEARVIDHKFDDVALWVVLMLMLLMLPLIFE